MKKNLLILILFIFCFSCNNQNSSITDNTDYEKGLNLITKSDCFGCHRNYESLIGPAYSLVGNKYKNTEENINLLADKIQKGGSGVWGQVPMAAHSNLSKEDAIAMVKYILLLKNEN